jgi:hypothetical protein
MRGVRAQPVLTVPLAVVVGMAAGLAVWIVIRTIAPRYRAEALLGVRRERDRNVLWSRQRAPMISGPSIDRLARSIAGRITQEDTLSLAAADARAQSAAWLAGGDGGSVRALAEALDVYVDPDRPEIIRITLSGPERRKAAGVVNAVADASVARAVERHLNIIKREIGRLRAQRDDLRDRLETVRRAMGAVDRRQKALTRKLSVVTVSLAEAEERHAVTLAAMAALRGATGTGQLPTTRPSVGEAFPSDAGSDDVDAVGRRLADECAGAAKLVKEARRRLDETLAEAEREDRAGVQMTALEREADDITYNLTCVEKAIAQREATLRRGPTEQDSPLYVAVYAATPGRLSVLQDDARLPWLVGGGAAFGLILGLGLPPMRWRRPQLPGAGQ